MSVSVHPQAPFKVMPAAAYNAQIKPQVPQKLVTVMPSKPVQVQVIQPQQQLQQPKPISKEEQRTRLLAKAVDNTVQGLKNIFSKEFCEYINREKQGITLPQDVKVVKFHFKDETSDFDVVLRPEVLLKTYVSPKFDKEINALKPFQRIVWETIWKQTAAKIETSKKVVAFELAIIEDLPSNKFAESRLLKSLALVATEQVLQRLQVLV
jgi:hypothetical protein